MSQSESLHREDDFPPPDGPRTPEEDEAFGAELDDPRAAGRFEDPYDVQTSTPLTSSATCVVRGPAPDGG